MRDIDIVTGYNAVVDDAERQHAPLATAIKTATGLTSEVHQSGGMVMVLITHVEGEIGQHYEGVEFCTGVETFHPDGTLSGGTSFFDHPAARALGEEYDIEGQTVLEFTAATPEQVADDLQNVLNAIRNNRTK